MNIYPYFIENNVYDFFIDKDLFKKIQSLEDKKILLYGEGEYPLIIKEIKEFNNKQEKYGENYYSPKKYIKAFLKAKNRIVQDLNCSYLKLQNLDLYYKKQIEKFYREEYNKKEKLIEKTIIIMNGYNEEISISSITKKDIEEIKSFVIKYDEEMFYKGRYSMSGLLLKIYITIKRIYELEEKMGIY
jgi:hypothetical protein